LKSESPTVPASVPAHIAIIMDGNGRWAKKHALSRMRGHNQGMETVRRIVTACRNMGVKYLTLYAFSEENWRRPAMEISALMKLLRAFLVSERKLMQENDIRVRAIGDLGRLPDDVRQTLWDTLKLTESHQSMSLVLALSYGGRDEIARAVRKIAAQVAKGAVAPEAIDAAMISAYLDTAGLPDPDLLIRTSGELRTSNFLPWQAIYTELYITPTLWPDFTPEELGRAIRDYNERERRFGLTSEQLPHTRDAAWTAAR
jgi:undecaprenyl diphosphate synthase